MLTVTEQAKVLLDGMIDEAARSAGQALRLTETEPGTLGLLHDAPGAGDQVVKQNRRPVLLVGPQIAEALTGATLDVIEGTAGPRLHLRRAEAE